MAYWVRPRVGSDNQRLMGRCERLGKVLVTAAFIFGMNGVLADEPEDPEETEPALLEAAGLQGEGRFLFRRTILKQPDRLLNDDALADDHTELLHRLTLSHFQGPLSLDAVFYTGLLLPLDRIYLDPDDIYGFSKSALFDLNRLTLQLQGDNASLMVGDQYAVAFRGGLLQLSQAPGIDLDVALQGAGFGIQGDFLSARAFAGRVHPQSLTFIQQNIDPARVSPPYTGPELPSLVRETPVDIVSGGILEGYSGPSSPIPFAYGVGTTLMSFDPTTTLGAVEFPDRQVDLRGYAAQVSADPLPGLSVYGEVNLFSYKVLSPDALSPFLSLPEAAPGNPLGGPLRGHLRYYSMVYGKGPIALLFEAKRSKDNQHFNVRAGGLRGYAFATPPSLEYERAVVEDTGLAIISNDIQSLHGQVDATINPSLRLRLDLLRVNDYDLNLGRQAPERVYHVYGGLDAYTQSGVHLSFMAGRRRGISCDALADDWQSDAVSSPDCLFEGEGLYERTSAYWSRSLDRRNDILMHGDGELTVPLGAYELEFSTGYLNFTLIEEDTNWFFQWQNALSIRKGHDKGITLYTDLSNNGQFMDLRFQDDGELANDQWSVGQGWLSTDLEQEDFPSRIYYALEVAYTPNWKYDFNLFYGSMMGGIRCAGGQCRSLPSFSGLRFAFTYRFS